MGQRQAETKAAQGRTMGRQEVGGDYMGGEVSQKRGLSRGVGRRVGEGKPEGQVGGSGMLELAGTQSQL